MAKVTDIFIKQKQKELRFLYVYLIEHIELFDFPPSGYKSKQGELWTLSDCITILKQEGFSVEFLEKWM